MACTFNDWEYVLHRAGFDLVRQRGHKTYKKENSNTGIVNEVQVKRKGKESLGKELHKSMLDQAGMTQKDFDYYLKGKDLSHKKEAAAEVEKQSIIKQYPEWKNAKQITNDEAKSIIKLNKSIGEKVPLREIGTMYDKMKAKLKLYDIELAKINQKEMMLKRAEQHIEKVEKYKAAIEDFEKPHNALKRKFNVSLEKSYQTCQAELKNEKSILKNLNIKDNNDYLKLSKDVQGSKPVIKSILRKRKGLEKNSGCLAKAKEAVLTVEKRCRPVEMTKSPVVDKVKPLFKDVGMSK